nr:NAD-glutamate dehydrogenase domain-containing protein [Streptomyces subrutilus]
MEENAWTFSHCVVEVVTDDMPSPVDSVTNELSRHGRGIHVVIHPQVVVRDHVISAIVRRSTEVPYSPKTLRRDTGFDHPTPRAHRGRSMPSGIRPALLPAHPRASIRCQ